MANAFPKCTVHAVDCDQVNIIIIIIIIINIIIIIIIINIIIITTRHMTAFGRQCLGWIFGWRPLVTDQSRRINYSHSIIHEFAGFARSDWMGLSGGAKFPCSVPLPP